MALYIREVVVAERVVSVLQRVACDSRSERAPQDQEEALVLWVSCITQALQERIHHHAQAQVSFLCHTTLVQSIHVILLLEATTSVEI